MRYLSRQTLRRLPAFFLPPVLLLSAGLTGLWLRERANDRRLARQLGHTALETQTRILQREFEGAVSTLLFLADQPTLQRFLQSGGTRDELAAEYAQLCYVTDFVERVQLFDEDGLELVRVDRESASPPAANGRPRALPKASGLGRGEVYSSGFEVDRVEGEGANRVVHSVVRFATPVFDADGTRRALLVLSCVGAELLQQLDRGAKSLPGWCALVNEEAYYLEAPAGRKSWAFLEGQRATFLSEFPRGWVDMQARERNQLDGRRGILSYCDWRPGPDLDLPNGPSDFHVRVVSFLSWDEIYASSTTLGRRLLLAGAGALLLTLAIAWPMAYAGALRSQHEAERAESERRLRRLSARILEVQEEERRGLARDLHDELGQLGTAAKIELDRALRASSPEKKDELLRAAAATTDRLLTGLHDVASDLRTNLLDDLGLESAVVAYAQELEEQHDLPVDLEVELGKDPLPPAVALTAYRLIQEGLTNVVKHASAKQARVGLRTGPGSLEVEVADDGDGFEPNGSTDRLGILGMRERVEHLSGTFRLSSRQGAGTRIEARLPLTAQDA